MLGASNAACGYDRGMADLDTIGGRELDALVAERIMGWKLDRARLADDGAPIVLNDLPGFTQEAPRARGVTFLLEQRHPGISVRHESQAPHRFVVRGPSGREYIGQDPSEATAMCRAMVKAMDGEGPGLPNDQLKPQRGPRVATTVAELLAARAQPHQSVGLSALAIVLQQGEHKEGAARALLEYAATVPHIVPHLAHQAASGERDVARMCVATLACLVKAGDAARAGLPAAASHADAEVAKAAREALGES